MRHRSRAMPTCEQKEKRKTTTTARVDDTKSAQKAAARNVSAGPDADPVNGAGARGGNECVRPGVGGTRDEAGAEHSSSHASSDSGGPKQVGTPSPTRSPVQQRQPQPKSPVCVAAQQWTPLRLRGEAPGALVHKGPEQSKRQLAACAGGTGTRDSINWQRIAELAGFAMPTSSMIPHYCMILIIGY